MDSYDKKRKKERTIWKKTQGQKILFIKTIVFSLIKAGTICFKKFRSFRETERKFKLSPITLQKV